MGGGIHLKVASPVKLKDVYLTKGNTTCDCLRVKSISQLQLTLRIINNEKITDWESG